MSKTSSLPMIQAISFWRPFWELCFLGKLAIGEYAVKTFNVPYHGRGLRLCHSGLKTAVGSMRAWDFNYEKIPCGVVGCALIVDSRELSDDDSDRLFIGYNNVKSAEDAEKKLNDPDSIYAGVYGIFMPRAYVFRFPKPFVPPVQHVFGPRCSIPLYPEIERQLPRWAKEQLAKAA